MCALSVVTSFTFSGHNRDLIMILYYLLTLCIRDVFIFLWYPFFCNAYTSSISLCPILFVMPVLGMYQHVVIVHGELPQYAENVKYFFCLKVAMLVQLPAIKDGLFCRFSRLIDPLHKHMSGKLVSCICEVPVSCALSMTKCKQWRILVIDDFLTMATRFVT